MLASAANHEMGNEQYCVMAVKSTVLKCLPHIIPIQKLKDETKMDMDTSAKYEIGPRCWSDMSLS
jgi:hypothetical protein